MDNDNKVIDMPNVFNPEKIASGNFSDEAKKIVAEIFAPKVLIDKANDCVTFDDGDCGELDLFIEDDAPSIEVKSGYFTFFYKRTV